MLWGWFVACRVLLVYIKFRLSAHGRDVCKMSFHVLKYFPCHNVSSCNTYDIPLSFYPQLSCHHHLDNPQGNQSGTSLLWFLIFCFWGAMESSAVCSEPLVLLMCLSGRAGQHHQSSVKVRRWWNDLLEFSCSTIAQISRVGLFFNRL